VVADGRPTDCESELMAIDPTTYTEHEGALASMILPIPQRKKTVKKAELV
jgi:hypothetical protein